MRFDGAEREVWQILVIDDGLYIHLLRQRTKTGAQDYRCIHSVRETARESLARTLRFVHANAIPTPDSRDQPRCAPACIAATERNRVCCATRVVVRRSFTLHDIEPRTVSVRTVAAAMGNLLVALALLQA